MSQSRPVLKIAVVSVFVVLMSGFVAYRSGAFDRYLGSTGISFAGEEMDAEALDTPGADSSKKMDMIMPSSKSGGAFIPRQQAKTDSTPKNRANTSPNNANTPNASQDVAPLVIPSSKSGPVFVPKSQAPAPTGVTGASGATAATGTTAPTGATGPTFMNSTKSGAVFTPSPGNDTPAPKKKKKKNPK